MDTIEQLINEIHEDNYSHLEFDENMGGEGCECAIHTTLNTIVKYRDKGEGELMNKVVIQVLGGVAYLESAPEGIEVKIIDLDNAEGEGESRECELCGSDSWRVLHAGDESNCECEGECLRVCDNPLLEDGCDGVAILIKGEGE